MRSFKQVFNPFFGNNGSFEHQRSGTSPVAVRNNKVQRSANSFEKDSGSGLDLEVTARVDSLGVIKPSDDFRGSVDSGTEYCGGIIPVSPELHERIVATEVSSPCLPEEMEKRHVQMYNAHGFKELADKGIEYKLDVHEIEFNEQKMQIVIQSLSKEEGSTHNGKSAVAIPGMNENGFFCRKTAESLLENGYSEVFLLTGYGQGLNIPAEKEIADNDLGDLDTQVSFYKCLFDIILKNRKHKEKITVDAHSLGALLLQVGLAKGLISSDEIDKVVLRAPANNLVKKSILDKVYEKFMEGDDRYQFFKIANNDAPEEYSQLIEKDPTGLGEANIKNLKIYKEAGTFFESEELRENSCAKNLTVEVYVPVEDKIVSSGEEIAKVFSEKNGNIVKYFQVKGGHFDPVWNFELLESNVPMNSKELD